jgi:DNA-binding transcriptional MerR regulator
MNDLAFMKQVVYINSISLHIINMIRLLRTYLGFSTRDIQKILELEVDGNLLGAIESGKNTAKYHDQHLNKLARAFTAKSFELGYNVPYSVSDFYPPASFKEEMVKKIIIKIEPTELGPTGTLHLLLVENNDPFFDEWHTSKEIAHYCGAQAGKNWEAKDFTAVIDNAIKKDTLIRKSEDEALFKRA